MDALDNAAPSVACPRCGYSLRGQVGLWEDCCPLRGTCSECGLEFDWGDIQRQRRLHWLFEHAWRQQPLRSFLRSFLAVLRPWRYWRALGMTDAFRPVGCVLFAVLSILVTPLALCGWDTIAVWYEQVIQGGSSLVSLGGIIEDIKWACAVDFEYIFARHFSAVSAAACIVTIPAAFVLLPFTRRVCRVRARHLFRAAAYSVGWLSWLALAWVALDLLRGLPLVDNAARFLLRVSRLEALAHTIDARQWVYMQTIALTTLPLTLWWGWATSRYLKMKHAWLIALTLSLLAALVAFGLEDLRLLVHFQRGGK
jgi:hypothetical protein